MDGEPPSGRHCCWTIRLDGSFVTSCAAQTGELKTSPNCLNQSYFYIHNVTPLGPIEIIGPQRKIYKRSPRMDCSGTASVSNYYFGIKVINLILFEITLYYGLVMICKP